MREQAGVGVEHQHPKGAEQFSDRPGDREGAQVHRTHQDLQMMLSSYYPHIPTNSLTECIYNLLIGSACQYTVKIASWKKGKVDRNVAEDYSLFSSFLGKLCYFGRWILCRSGRQVIFIGSVMQGSNEDEYELRVTEVHSGQVRREKSEADSPNIYHEPYASNRINCLLRPRRRSIPNLRVPQLEGSTFVEEANEVKESPLMLPDEDTPLPYKPEARLGRRLEKQDRNNQESNSPYPYIPEEKLKAVQLKRLAEESKNSQAADLQNKSVVLRMNSL